MKKVILSIVASILLLVFLFGSDCPEPEEFIGPQSGEGSPGIAITNPDDGDVVVGWIVPIGFMCADDKDGTLRVKIYIDNKIKKTLDVGFNWPSPCFFTYEWNITNLPDSSSHTIYARVYDNLQNEGISDTISVIVYHGDDTLAPVVSIVNPNDGDSVGGDVLITAEAIDNTEIINSVKIYIDDSLRTILTREPYTYEWETFCLPNDSSHTVYAKAYDLAQNEGVSDTISVITNNSMTSITIFSDGFEDYADQEYPSSGGWYVLWNGGYFGITGTYVTDFYSYSGNKSFKLMCFPIDDPRKDGVNLDLTDVITLTYEFAVMVPTSSNTGAVIGFYKNTAPNEQKIYNGIILHYFSPRYIYVIGTSITNTGYIWELGSWYLVKVEIDFCNLTMDVWVNNEMVASEIEAMPRETSNIFSVGTENYTEQQINANGHNYYDDIEITVNKINIIKW